MSFPARAQPLPEWDDDAQDLLTWDDLVVVQSLLVETAPSWSAELNHSGPGESTIVVTPEGANDLIGPAFILHRGDGRVHLDQFRWDEYRKLGGFRTLREALAAMRSRLTLLASRGAQNRDRAEF